LPPTRKSISKCSTSWLIAFDEPAAFLGWVGERGEDAFLGGWIRALDDEGVVDDGWLFHGGLLSRLS
jgi:hypothetical protein